MSLKEIRESARASGYKGYRADAIAKADKLHEPRRSQVLREIREQAKRELNNDVSLYRKLRGNWQGTETQARIQALTANALTFM